MDAAQLQELIRQIAEVITVDQTLELLSAAQARVQKVAEADDQAPLEARMGVDELSLSPYLEDDPKPVAETVEDIATRLNRERAEARARRNENEARLYGTTKRRSDGRPYTQAMQAHHDQQVIQWQREEEQRRRDHEAMNAAKISGAQRTRPRQIDFASAAEGKHPKRSDKSKEKP